MGCVRRGVALFVLLLSGAVVGGCGSSSQVSESSSPGSETTTGSTFDGLVIQPPKPVPALALRDYTGRAVNLAAFRGKAVLVTFVYTHCPDVCPLIVTNLAAAQRQLASEARRLQILAVTVDPKRDTPRAVKEFLAARRATGAMDYLIGSRQQLLPVWKAWGVAVSTNKYEQAEGHTAVVFGITPSGKIAVAYPSSFTPADIVHDVPLLAQN
jgi:protein SCO1